MRVCSEELRMIYQNLYSSERSVSCCVVNIYGFDRQMYRAHISSVETDDILPNPS